MTTATDLHQPPLWTKDFIGVFLSNLLLFFSFYMLIPILPQYLLEQMNVSGSFAGIILSLYTLSALCIRPFSGFMADTFSRKPLYLICYAVFSILFAGYIIGTFLTLFVFLRILHGAAFGLSTVSGSTVAVDVMPSERRGEGIGYYGMTASIAMAIGPFAGLYMESHYGYKGVFIASFITSVIGWLCITMIRPIRKAPSTLVKEPLSLDRFILVKGLPLTGFLFISGLGYGSVLNYVGLYSQQAGYIANAGLFFIFLACGVLLARFVSGKMINKGKLVLLTYWGGSLLLMGFALLTFNSWSYLFYVTAFLLGMGYGYTNPVFQTMLIHMASHNQRGTANATYFTFWDLGIGLGTLFGGIFVETLGFKWMYGFCTLLIALGLIFFAKLSAPYYQRHTLG